MSSEHSITTRILATFCSVCPACIAARCWPRSRYAKVLQAAERSCPACRAYARTRRAPAVETPPSTAFFGRMNDPTAAATIKGLCGDEMEFYLVIEKDRITEVRYYTEGCGNTRSCGDAVARRALGKSVTDALSISAGEIIRSGECEAEAGRHCAILAVTTLYRALADYLLKP